MWRVCLLAGWMPCGTRYWFSCCRGRATETVPFTAMDFSAVLRCVGYGPADTVPNDATFEMAEEPDLFPEEAVAGSDGGSIRFACRLHRKAEVAVLQAAIDEWNAQKEYYSLVGAGARLAAGGGERLRGAVWWVSFPSASRLHRRVGVCGCSTLCCTLHCLRCSLVCAALVSPTLVAPLPAFQNWDLEYRDSDEAKQATKHIRFLFENYEPKYDNANARVLSSRLPPRLCCVPYPPSMRSQ
jgi:hypothetical protein